MAKRIPWTREEAVIIRDHAETHTAKEISQLLHKRVPGAVIKKAERLGIVLTREREVNNGEVRS